MRERRLRSKWIRIFSVISLVLLVSLYYRDSRKIRRMRAQIISQERSIDSLKKIANLYEAEKITKQQKISQYEFTFDYLKLIDFEAFQKVKQFLEKTPQ